MRRLIILPMTKCGPPTPKNRPMKQRQQERRAAEHQQRARRRQRCRAQTMRIFAERDVLAGHLQPLAQQRRLGDQGRGIAFEPACALRPSACGSAPGHCRQMTSPWRSLMSSMRRLSALRGRWPAQRREGEHERADAADHDVATRACSCLRLSLLAGGADARARDRGTSLTRPCPSASASIDFRLSTSDLPPAGALRLGSGAFLAGMAQHHARQAC